MLNQNIISNKFDLKLTTMLSSYYEQTLGQGGIVCQRKKHSHFCQFKKKKIYFTIFCFLTFTIDYFLFHVLMLLNFFNFGANKLTRLPLMSSKVLYNISSKGQKTYSAPALRSCFYLESQKLECLINFSGTTLAYLPPLLVT